VGMSFAGDSTVSIIITQTFLGGPFPNFSSSSSGTITDANNDGHASLLGSPFIQTTFVNGSLVGQQNTGCDLTGPPGLTSPCPTSASQSLLFDSPRYSTARRMARWKCTSGSL